jgi:hypothetical protein
MDKRTYYVAVGAGDILDAEIGPVENFDFEIVASQNELDELQELFEDTNEAESRNAHYAVIPYDSTTHDSQNGLYDKNLREIYVKLYELGTAETRSHIEKMHVLH